MAEPLAEPAHELGVVVPLDVALASSADAVIHLAAAVVHRRGLVLAVVAQHRGGLWDGAPDGPVLEIETADGAVRASLDGVAAPADPAAPLRVAPALAPVGRGVWISPLPASGAIRLVAAWPAEGLEGRAVELDAPPLAARAAGVLPLPSRHGRARRG